MPAAGPPDDHCARAAQLLALIAMRDAVAFSELYDRFSHALRAVAIRILDEAEADDVLQEVFIKVWEHASHYAPEQGTPATWLITITRNSALNRLRARKRNAAVMERAAAEPPSEGPRAAAGTYECVVSAEDAALVRSALADLPEEQRVPLELAYLRGLTFEEVALHLGHPLGSVKSRLRRGMARMRAALSVKDCTRSVTS